MVPNYFKKGIVQRPGCIYANGLTIAVETGWSGFTADYGPTDITEFYPGPVYFSGNGAVISSTGQRSVYSLNNTDDGNGMSVVVVATGVTPYFTTLCGATTNVSTISWLGRYQNPPTPTTGALQAGNNVQAAITSGETNGTSLNNTTMSNFYISDLPTSGLTCGIIPNYLPMRTKIALATGQTTTYKEFSFNQDDIEPLSLANPTGFGRVRNNTYWAFNGTTSKLTISGNCNDYANDFTFAIYGALISSLGPNQYIITSGSGSTKNFAIKYWNASASTHSMVIETSNSIYSATTSGTLYNGFTTTATGWSNALTPIRWTILTKQGNTFRLYYTGNIPYTATTLMWEVTINDWTIVDPNIPVSIYHNPILNTYTPGEVQELFFYNRVLTNYETRNLYNNSFLISNGFSFSQTAVTTPYV